MGFFNLTNDLGLSSLGSQLATTIEKAQYEAIESEYIHQLEKMKADLASLNVDAIPDYIKSMDEIIEKLKHQIIKSFSIHNNQLTEEYMDEHIISDTILTIELNGTTKSDDILQYLKAQDHFQQEYRDALNDIPHIWGLPPSFGLNLLIKGLKIAELRFLAKQSWIIL